MLKDIITFKNMRQELDNPHPLYRGVSAPSQVMVKFSTMTRTNTPPLKGKLILVTGSARRIGRALAIACARAGADVIIHHAHSDEEAGEAQQEVLSLGRQAWVIPADFDDPLTAKELITRANKIRPLFALVNSAAIFEDIAFRDTTLEAWDRHLRINLSAPFLLSQAFAQQFPEEGNGCIVNILDWRALRPGISHFPYTISKAGLTAMTQSLAIMLAPRITVNGLALGAILPPTDQPVSDKLIKRVPAGKWGQLEDVEEALIFLLSNSYITGEIIHIDGGRHLT